jgi:RNA polymerase sigma-70 factor (ECF subfamily)
VTVTPDDWLAEEFERQRPRMRAVAYRMLGSASEADDAIQEAWLRLSRSDSGTVDNLAAWLTTVVGRICLDMLRARNARREDYAGSWLPEPIVEQGGPQDEALLADAVGMALLVVLDALEPAERLAFVLHDMFGVPFSDIAEIVGRSPDAARQLASRARRRVRGRVPEADPDLELQRKVVDAFLAASREGDFAGLVAVLDPDVVFRIDTGGTPAARDPVSGAETVARQILARGTPLAPLARPAIVNGGAGAVVAVRGRPFAVVAFTIAGGRILAIDLVIDPAKLGSVS